MENIYRVNTRPQALVDNIIQGEKYRITLLTEAMKMPEVRQQFAQGVRNGGKKHR